MNVKLAIGARYAGLAIALPPGYAAFVHPRSGLAARHGVTLVNAPGTVDAGYRGEIKVTLLNTDTSQTIINFVANTTNFPYTTAAPTATQMRDRVRAIVHLILTSAEYAVQK